MILKIERIAEYQEWWIFDSIRKISVGKIIQLSSDDLGKALEFDPDVFLMDHANIARNDPGNKSNLKYRELILRLDSGEELSVVFDTVAYLCNDVGKTIEKITV